MTGHSGSWRVPPPTRGSKAETAGARFASPTCHQLQGGPDSSGALWGVRSPPPLPPAVPRSCAGGGTGPRPNARGEGELQLPGVQERQRLPSEACASDLCSLPPSSTFVPLAEIPKGVALLEPGPPVVETPKGPPNPASLSLAPPRSGEREVCTDAALPSTRSKFAGQQQLGGSQV